MYLDGGASMHLSMVRVNAFTLTQQSFIIGSLEIVEYKTFNLSISLTYAIKSWLNLYFFFTLT